MIYLTNGNTPLNAAYADEIVQIDSNTYQLAFRFPTSDSLWEKLKEETFLTADDLHGEQDFVIFEVEKKHGYIQVYANQVFTLLNNYVVNPISLDRQTGSTALSRFAGSITRSHPFSFFSDISERHTFNIDAKNAMEAFAKDKHSILGQWGGDLVRHGYQVRLLKNGGSENESLFMYKKNLSSYQHKTSTKSLKTRITFKTTVKGEGEKAPDRTFTVTIDSPLISKYSQIYEDVIEVNDEDVKDEASLRKYGEQYFKTSLCDMMEDSLELEVVGQSDVPVQMYDIVSLFHEVYNLDVRKKITKYTYSPMAKKLISIGFGQFKSGLSNMVSNAVSDAVKNEAQQLHDDFERQLERELKNADLAFDRHKEELVNQFTDGLNAAKARAEEVKRELSDTIDQRFSSFNNGPLQEAKRRAEEALRNAGASSLLAQEAKRIGLDSIAKLEAFKSQATSAQTALSGDLDALKRTIAKDIRPKQAQVETEIAKQVEALIQTKNELAGVKSAQATYEETTTRRLAELANVADGKASKSELVQTADELASKIASVQVGSSRNYFRNSRSRTFTTGDQATYDYRTFIVPDFWKNNDRFKRDYVRLSFDVTFPVALASDTQANVHFSAHPWHGYKLTFKGGTTERQHFEFTIDLSSSSETYQTNNVFIRFGTNFGFPSGLQVVIENAMLSVGNYFPAYQPAYEDQEDRVSVVESNFKQRADSLDAGVNRLTEGLRKKADISALNVTAENIRQSVKSLETNTQNKLDQKLSQAEFEVQAGSIRQEILNATKDKADKTLVVAEAGKLREEFSRLRVGGRNLLRGSKGPFMPDKKPTNFDNNVLYAEQTSVYMEQGQEYTISAKTDGNFTAHHDGNKESYNVVLWIMDKNVRNYQIVSDLKTGTTGTKFVWDKPTGIYHLRVNTYHKEATKSVWDVKIEKGNVATDWSPAIEDTDGLITETKAIFERTAQGLRTDLSAIQDYVNKDGQRQEALQRYAREESARQANAVRELVNRDFVGKATYQEDVKGLERRFSAISTQTNNDIATKIAQYKQTVDGQFSSITSQIAGKANQTDFQRVRETSQLYERILGNTDNGIADNVARMAVTNQIFQVEVGKYGGGGPNLVKNSDFKDGIRAWNSSQNVAKLVKHEFYLNGQKDLICLPNSTQKELFLFSPRFELEKNTDYVLNFRAFNNNSLTNCEVFVLGRRKDENTSFTIAKLVLSKTKFSTNKCEDVSITFNSGEMDNAYIRFDNNGTTDGIADLYITEVDLYKGYKPRPWQPHPEDVVTDANAKLEAIRTQMTLLQGSWAVQNLTSAGSIVSQINATNNQILIEAEKIRLKGKTLLDELTAIQGYFKRLFVGEGTFATLNTDILRANSITADKLVMDMAMARRFVSSDIFTDTLAAKEAFINKLRSVVVTATLLEGYKGRIGGFQIGTHEKDSSVYWITGENQFSVGMSNGTGQWSQTALWVNWGNNWGYPGDYAWYVKNNGKMYCYNTAEFWNTPVIHGNLRVTGHIFYNNENSGKSGYWIHSSKYSNFEPSNNYLYLYYSGSGYDWIPMNKEISDRRYKHNIEASTVSGLDVVESLKTYSYRKKYDGKIEDIACGIMAQDVQKYAPEAFFENPDGAYSYNTFALVPYLIKAIQELNQKIEKLEKTA
ncbi:phage tail spike protein [Streptococcus sp. 5905]|uniref:phage tail spike protein n=1 Tax=Streptococcus sp. 5905 TaxID=2582683 RepID=UPI00156748DD|nr:phage tail spike protein [Streptococcus sp. 5905]